MSVLRRLAARGARVRGRLPRPHRRLRSLRSTRQRNLRFLAVADRLPRPLPDGLAPALSGHAGRRLRFGTTDWTALSGTVPALREAARRGVDAADPAAARPVLDLLLDQTPPNSATQEILGYLGVLDDDTDTAVRYFTMASVDEPGSVARRRARAERRHSHERERLAIRTAASHPLPAELAERQRDVLAAPFTRHGPLEDAAERLVVRALLAGELAGLEPLAAALRRHGRLVPSTAEVPGVDAVVEAAAALRADGDYVAAHTSLQRAPARPEALVPPLLDELATVLSARSRYPAARIVLAILADAEEWAGPAAVRQAQIAWILHDDEETVQAARRAIRLDAGSPPVRTLRRRGREPITPADPPAGGVGHVAFYVDAGENFGDISLPVAVRQSIEASAGPRTWLPFHAHQLFDAEFVRLANTQRALVVGGGGLFLPDTAPNGHSGWQWNVPSASLEAIEVPLYVYTVGYNLFPGQRFHGSLFGDSLVALARKAEFLGLRNTGSMDRVRELLPDELRERVRYAPCATTVIERLTDDLPPAEPGTGTVLVNAAFDRAERRFGDGYADVLAQINTFVETVEAGGAHVRFVAHARGDTRIATDLEETHGRTVPVDSLQDLDLTEAYGVYRRASVVIGMRGHATMIPFGLGTPVLSIVSHPKLRYFLEDIGRPEWAHDVGDDRLGDRLAEHTADILAGEDRYRDDVHRLQEDLLKHVRAAAGEIADTVAG